MAGTASRGFGIWGSTAEYSSSQRCQCGEVVTECRSLEQSESETPSTSEDDDDLGLKASDLYGKVTWKIEKFSQINKRELRSSVFEVGGYNWYILIYPQGCDVCNHLSLFLCVANHDKLLPGWSHFAQFTISIVNKDPKKSKYSDTLHRFWKKEHDWGWKKFVELSKVSDEFLDNDTLVIKAQVQVIRENVNSPFRCLDSQYKRELIRVYVINVEQICRRFIEEKRSKFVKLIEDKAKWTSFRGFWLHIDESTRKWMSSEKKDILLRRVVKHFFLEKEVTSTLVMDSLYSGLKILEDRTTHKKGSRSNLQHDEIPVPIVRLESEVFVLAGNVVPLLERVATQPLPPKAEKGPQVRTKDGGPGDESYKNDIEQDEMRFTELGRRTLEMYILGHIYSNRVEIAYQEALSLRMQEDLIREEAETEKKGKQRSIVKENKSKKKQAKQKRGNQRAKDKGRDKKTGRGMASHFIIAEEMEELAAAMGPLTSDEDDASALTPNMSQMLCSPPNPEDMDSDASKTHGAAEECGGPLSMSNGTEEKTAVMDDSSSTCSAESASSVVMNSSFVGKSFPQDNMIPVTRKKNQKQKGTRDEPNRMNGVNRLASASEINMGHLKNGSVSCKVTTNTEVELVLCLQDKKKYFKDVNSPEMKTANHKHSIKGPNCPVNSPKFSAASPPLKLLSRNNAGTDVNVQKDKSSHSAVPNGHAVPMVLPLRGTATPNPDTRVAVAPQLRVKSLEHQVPLISRPFSAPAVSGPRPAAPVVTTVKAAPNINRSVSVAGQLGSDQFPFPARSFVLQSYKSAVMRNEGGSSSLSCSSLSSSSVHPPIACQEPSPSALSMAFLTSRNDSVAVSANSFGLSFGMSTSGVSKDGALWMNSSPKCLNGSKYLEPSSLSTDMQRLNFSSGSSEHVYAQLPASSNGHQSQSDDFPHLDIINDLLDDEISIRNNKASSTSPFNGPTIGSFHHTLNMQPPFPGEMGLSGEFDPSTSSFGLGETQISHTDGFQRSYNSYNSPLYSVRDMMTQGRPMNFQTERHYMDQWQLPGFEMCFPHSMQSPEGDYYGYPVPPEYSNYSGSINDYGVFRHPNGH